MLGKKHLPLLGIDISSTAVKLLELRRADARYRVECYAVEPLPPNAVVEKRIENPEAVSEALKAAVRRSQSKAKTAAVAVPASSAISKVITMPASLSEDEMEAQIELQADQYVPYPLEEVNLDFQMLGPVAGNADEAEVLLVASRSENVESRVDVLQAAGLSAQVVDVESYAMENAYSLMAASLPGGADQTVAVVDIGATMTALTVLENQRIIYTREQIFGGRQLTEEIMRRYGLSYEEAGRAKRQGGLPDSYEDEVLAPFKETMAEQVARSLQFFFSSGQHASVDHVLVAGGCAAIPGAAELIQDYTGTPASKANPFANMPVSSRVRPHMLSEDAPALLIACGLAMRGFD
ncbi:pilus assembly protein PilM [Alkalilimnicola sp. S0819]|nr:pilus assembly protein PilM [Alkalilimnicola sp. S0819]MPQ16241.1 type IV pilus assembly protein PilM [Alkalilimnicola sp. S0819]